MDYDTLRWTDDGRRSARHGGVMDKSDFTYIGWVNLDLTERHADSSVLIHECNRCLAIVREQGLDSHCEFHEYEDDRSNG